MTRIIIVENITLTTTVKAQFKESVKQRIESLRKSLTHINSDPYLLKDTDRE